MPSSPGQMVRYGCPGARRAGRPLPGGYSTSAPVTTRERTLPAIQGSPDKCHAVLLMGVGGAAGALALTLLETARTASGRDGDRHHEHVGHGNGLHDRLLGGAGYDHHLRRAAAR